MILTGATAGAAVGVVAAGVGGCLEGGVTGESISGDNVMRSPSPIDGSEISSPQPQFSPVGLVNSTESAASKFESSFSSSWICKFSKSSLNCCIILVSIANSVVDFSFSGSSVPNKFS